MPVYDFRLDYPESVNDEDVIIVWVESLAEWLVKLAKPKYFHYGLEHLNKFRDCIKYHAHLRFESELSESKLRSSIKSYYISEYGRELGRSDYKLGNVDKRKGVVTDTDFWRYPWKECRRMEHEVLFWDPIISTQQELVARDQRDRDQKINIEKRDRENNHKTTSRKIIDFIEINDLPKSSKENIFAACIAWCKKEDHAIDYKQLVTCSRLICLQLNLVPAQYFVDKIAEIF